METHRRQRDDALLVLQNGGDGYRDVRDVRVHGIHTVAPLCIFAGD